MRLLVTAFFGVIFGFFVGITFPPLSLIKVPNVYALWFELGSYFQPVTLVVLSIFSYQQGLQISYDSFIFPVNIFWQLNIPSALFPSVDLTYIEDKYSGLSTQAFLNAWSALKGNGGNAAGISELISSKVCHLLQLLSIITTLLCTFFR